MLMRDMENQGFKKTIKLPSEVERLASYSLQQLLLEGKLNSSTLSQEVGVFVELIWTEALGSLVNILKVPISKISLNDVSRVEGLLLQAQKTQNEEEVKALLEEANTLLPLNMADPPSKNKLVSQKLDLCQLIRDIVNVSEASQGSPFLSSLGKYRALRCSIEAVPSQSPEFYTVSQLLHDRPVQIQKIMRVERGVELQMFRQELGNIKPLLHSTSPSSLVGILSRGLLLPRVGVELHGIERTDIGNLGGGIYFSDSLKTSVKYSKPSATDGSRLLLVCDVALGLSKCLQKKDTSLTCPPYGFHSVHGVRRTLHKRSDFEDDEFVVYNTEQIRLKYVVQFTLEGDELKEFNPQINTSEDLKEIPTDVLSFDDSDSLESTKNPLKEMDAGLLDSRGQKVPLKAVNVRCKMIDLLCQVNIFQTYTNQSAVPIEAKYVFPLEETAAVCGFEAFINGKHIIGKVKEKEQARKEYKQAIEKGHGAYLMDQDEPDVFTISVGNLPPGATVLIKVTFITELVVRSGSILFSLSGSTTVQKIGVLELQTEGEFSLSMSIEMPYEIINMTCSHRIKTKMTDCKAVISTLPGQNLGSEGLQLSFSLSNIHMPRMWVENHPDKSSQACMLVFYPDFKPSGISVSDSLSSVSDVVILLDSSMSMQGDAMLNARRIAIQILKSLERSLKINIISFSTDYKEAFPAPIPLTEASEEARAFIMTCGNTGGSTDLWRPLRSLSLLPPSRGMRNIVLLSDGHIQNQPLTLQLVQENSSHTRFFTCGLSTNANRHMLRALAQAGGGTYEYFDTKMKHTWMEKVRSQVQRMESPGCRSVAVKWQQFNPTAPPPVQAPSQLHALFSDWHTLVYGFVPHCTQATLFGDLSGQEIKTMVSTTELQKTKGTFLHKLTARAIIRDYEDGILGNSEAEHEGKKAELKSYIIELSKEFSILSQFTSFVAIEERDPDELETGFTDIDKIISEEDVDILPYMGWREETLENEESMCFDDEQFLFCQPHASRETPLALMDLDLGEWPMSSEKCLIEPAMSDDYSDVDAYMTSAVDYEFSNSCVTKSSVPAESWIKERTHLHRLSQTPAPPPPAFSLISLSSSISDDPLPRAVSSVQFKKRSIRKDLPASAPVPPPPPPPQFRLATSILSFDSSPASIAASASPPLHHPGLPTSYFAGSAGSALSESSGQMFDEQMQDSAPLTFGFASRRLNYFSRKSACLTQRFEQHECQGDPNAGGEKTMSLSSQNRKYSEDKEQRRVEGSSRHTGVQCKRLSGEAVMHSTDLESAYRYKTRRGRKSVSIDYVTRPEPAWNVLFKHQQQYGYWECTSILSSFLNLDMEFFANVFLTEKGICVKARADILRLLATMLVLQLIRVKNPEAAYASRTMFEMLNYAVGAMPMYWGDVKRAVEWARQTDRQYPCVCSRLEIGWDWESSTRQLLGYDPPHPCSSLRSVLARDMSISVL
ncbi:hypothetical protein DNTS_023453 [Danionella cerebrum]|uniref:Poly [ADP-ribose] polymerase n=1 Tax=Danionella cerebrum TaxID=2873325 RepID=A0A553QVH7_9TELE|nr:hypothetical protein DNTS_023453 [Danionella translucida]